MPKTNKPPIEFSDLARAEVESVSASFQVNEADLLRVVAEDAERELSSAALKHVAWFKEQPRHCFHAARIRNGEATKLDLFMVVDPAERCVYSTVESPLPDEYFAERVIEETRLEIKLGNL